MNRNTSVTLSKHFDDFIEERIASGRFESKSEAIREGLRLLEERENRIAALRKALIAGEESGESTYFDFETFIQRKHKEVSQK